MPETHQTVKQALGQGVHTHTTTGRRSQLLYRGLQSCPCQGHSKITFIVGSLRENNETYIIEEWPDSFKSHLTQSLLGMACFLDSIDQFYLIVLQTHKDAHICSFGRESSKMTAF